MLTIKKKVKDKAYFYFSLIFCILNKTKNFRKYIDFKKPILREVNNVEDSFCDEIIKKNFSNTF